MSPIRRFDHVGITVAHLDTVTAFFVGLGFEVEGRMVMEGEFVDTVIGIPNSRKDRDWRLWAALGFVESSYWISGHCRCLMPSLELDWGKHAQC